jgi:hypothetical protein
LENHFYFCGYVPGMRAADGRAGREWYPGRGTVVRINPASRTTAVGGTFTVEIWVDNVIDLYGADIQLAFDPTAFEVVGEAITVRYDFLQPELCGAPRGG